MATVVVLGCDLTTGPDDDLADARRRWEAVGLIDYDLRQSVSCFCLPQTTRTVRIAVRNGFIAEAWYDDTGDIVPDAFRQTLRTVTGLFQEVEGALRTGAFRLDVTYDAAAGYPREIFIDQNEMTVDEEIGWTTVQLPTDEH